MGHVYLTSDVTPSPQLPALFCDTFRAQIRAVSGPKPAHRILVFTAKSAINFRWSGTAERGRSAQGGKNASRNGSAPGAVCQLPHVPRGFTR
jgi:hypothetical protein